MGEQGKWHFAPGAAELFPDGDPEQLLAGAEPVKENPVRRVLRSRGFYIKIDRRPGHGFGREFAAGCRLAELGLPVVEHLARGVLSDGAAALVTRELPGAVDARKYFSGGGNRGAAEALAHLVGRMWRAGVFHGDCHLGNFLYAPDGSGPVLVDVDSVRRRHWFDAFRRGRVLRVVSELRMWFPRPEIEELLALAGADEPGKFFTATLRREAEFLRREWPKRREQILAGYPKFTRNSGGLLLVAGAAADDLEALPVVTGDAAALEKLLLIHFFLLLAEIPHRGVVAFDRSGGRLFLASGATGCPLTDGDLELRLRSCGAAVLPSGVRDGVIEDPAAVQVPPWLWE